MGIWRPLPRVAVLASLATVAFASLAFADDDLLDGTVLAVDDVPIEPVLEGAREEEVAEWRGERIEASDPEAHEPPTTEIDAMRNDWMEADFSRCLARARTETLDITRLLERGQREAAGSVLAISAGCAVGARDESLATSLIDRALRAELDLEREARQMTTDLQRLLGSRREGVRNAPRVTLTIQPRPSDATIEVDGRPCEARPCVLELAAGEHLVVARRLGYLTRVQPLVVDRDQQRVLTLDPAPSATQRRQLASAFGGGLEPGDVEALRVAASAYGSPLLLAAWPRTGGYRLALFDRRVGEGGALVARADTESGSADLERSARNLVAEWADLQPRSILRSPWFWITTVLVVGAAVTAAVLLTRDPDPRFSIMGR